MRGIHKMLRKKSPFSFMQLGWTSMSSLSLLPETGGNDAAVLSLDAEPKVDNIIHHG
jgi:hypothetical protein